MPVPELMTWIPAQRRWTRMYRGRRYYVSARQLGTVETKESSLQAANQWWRDKQAEIDLAYRACLPAPRTPAPLDDLLEALDIPLPQEQEGMLVKYARLNQLMELFRKVLIEGQPWPERVREKLSPARTHQLETGAKGIRGETATSAERTVRAQLDAWLTKQRTLVSIGAITAAYSNNAHHCLKHFVAFLGESADVSIIDRDRLDGFHNFCLSKLAERLQDAKAGWSTSYAKEVFATARAWVRWLVEQGTIEPPRNLNSRGFRFGPAAQKVETWTEEEVRFVVGKATGRLQLALLLMLNCGMTQKDVSDLRDEEVDWAKGRITRKRSKTKGQANVPVVEYPLWVPTFALLKRYRSGQDRVLLTKSGGAFVRKGHVNGQLRGGDSFAENYKYLRVKIGFTKPMKLLRKTAASKLESHETYGRFTSLFLGHAPQAMKDRHYVRPPQNLFDAGVRWLGGQFGLADLEV
jgi:integrase